jgi:hypothetical protein
MDLLLAGLPAAAMALDLGNAVTVLDVELRVALAARRARRGA